MPRSSTPRTLRSTLTISWALASLTCRSGPTTFTVFSPLTPDIASSTLSEMTCEKLNTTPGNAAERSACISAVMESLVTPLRHLLAGERGASSSML